MRDLLWMGAGSGLSGAGEGVVNQLTKGALAGNLASGALGFALARFTTGIPKLMGKGMMIKAVGDFVEQNVAPKLIGLTTGNATPSNAQSPTF